MTDQKFTSRLDWEDLRVFLALARHGSLSAAARALGVTHATVARRVSGLEALLGEPLFERRPTGYRLTPSGHEVLERAAGMEALAAGVIARPTSPQLRGSLRITATASLAEGYLLPRLLEFQRLHPAIDIALVADSRVLSLARHEVDLALRYAEQPEDSELLSRKLVELGSGFYASAAWAERLRAGEPPCFIGFDEANAHLPLARWLERRFPQVRLSFRSNNHLTQAEAARQDAGVALLPRFVAQGLQPVLTGEQPPSRFLWLLSRPDLRQTPHLAAAADYLADCFRRDAAQF